MCIHFSALRQPAPTPEQATFAWIGQVRAPRFLSLADLYGLPQHSRRLTLVCTAAAPDPRRWHTATWTGVPLRVILAEAGMLEDARSVQVAGYNGRVTAYALADLNDALLALEADGQPLSAAQGFPARLLIPGRAACAMPRFVQRFTFSPESVSKLNASQPLALVDRVRVFGSGVRIEGRALGAESVAVRQDDGPPVQVVVTGGDTGLAGNWVLDWPSRTAAHASFSVQALPDSHSPGTRPLARRWKPRLHTWTPDRSRKP
jgi:DMSO/TMAO reductase YedYZ molybdopterin-dependent catalytic subunit